MKRATVVSVVLILLPTAASACDYCKLKLTCQGQDCWTTPYCGSPGVPGTLGGDCNVDPQTGVCTISNFCQLVSLSPRAGGSARQASAPEWLLATASPTRPASRCS